MKKPASVSQPSVHDSESEAPSLASVSQPSVRVVASPAAQEDSEMEDTASKAEPSVRDTASPAPSTDVGKTKTRNALTFGVADAIVNDLKAWYEERIGDESVAAIWKLLHSVLFKKVRVPPPADLWSPSASVSQPSASEADDPVDGIPMVVSEEFVALQVKNLIERRENG